MPAEPREPLRTCLITRYGIRLYKQLYEAGADLEYVWFLDQMLFALDSFAKEMTNPRSQKDTAKDRAKEAARERAKRARRRKKTKQEVGDIQWQATTDDSLGAFQILRLLYEEQQEGPILRIEAFIGRDGPELGLGDADVAPPLRLETFRVQASDLASLVATAFPSFFPRGRPRPKLLKQTFIGAVFREYLPRLGRYHKGGTEDLRGSFFLLAVTQHLARIHGRYDLAGRLLNVIRKLSPVAPKPRTPNAKRHTEYEKPSTLFRELTRKRIDFLKKDHSAWESHLETLDQFWRNYARR